MLEIVFTVIIPYPGLEMFVPHACPSALIFLSAAVVVRTVFWRHILFFPYPIRQKGKVASFADNFGLRSLRLCRCRGRLVSVCTH